MAKIRNKMGVIYCIKRQRRRRSATTISRIALQDGSRIITQDGGRLIPQG